MNGFEKIIKKVHEFLSDNAARKNGKLASGCYFINADDVLCLPRDFGDSRRPYSANGLTLWAHSSGNIKIEESTFNYNLEFDCGKDPKIAFYFGENGKRDKVGENNEFLPVSITGAGVNARENGVERYCVFTDSGAYYIAESENFAGGVFANVDGNKRVNFEVFVKNNGKKTKNTYISAYYDLILLHKNFEYIETKWYRENNITDFGFLTETTEYLNRTTCLNHYATIERRAGEGAGKTKVYSTCSPANFRGAQHLPLASACSLKTGKIENGKRVTAFSEGAVSADVMPLTLNAGESASVKYVITVSPNKQKLVSAVGKEEKEPDEFLSVCKNLPEIEFKGNKFGVSDFVLSSFVKSVLKQTEFCTRAKNYAGPLIGVRDIFQQLEAAFLWIPGYCRKKIVEALNFVGDDGRCPRQYSYPDNPSVLPEMDLREYVDQGVWVISTVYGYVSLTGDYSILNEICGYYKFKGQTVDFSDRKDSVADHLIAICDFLLANVDEQTHCLHSLYGDWNDALDGLGKTKDANKEFGTGVSVMATLQLYKNLKELAEILNATGIRPEKAKLYLEKAEEIAGGIKEFAITEKGGEKKILHGWGDKRAYEVGGFCDNDGASRDSATSNAFFVLSGMIEQMPEMKEFIEKAYARLDSKFGIKTFEPYFALDNKEVGRITHLPKGTAENGATYIHATLFAIWSLFKLGDSEKAWEQIAKILPVTHDFISTTPFVMPNSYVYNKELGLDGESMSDWFTGSGCVLIKVLLLCAFGIKADFNSLKIEMPKTLAFDKMSAKLNLKGGEITVIYENRRDGNAKKTNTANGETREFYVDGKRVDSICLSNADITGKALKVEIIDYSGFLRGINHAGENSDRTDKSQIKKH